MTHTRRSLNSAVVATRSEDLSKLSSEVLKLRLQALNLPLTGSKVQLLARLKQASMGKVGQSKRRPGQPQRTRHMASKTATQQPSTAAGEIDATQGRRLGIPADSTLSDHASLSSVEDMLQSDKRKISSLLITVLIKEKPSVQRSVLSSRTLYPGLYTTLWTPSVQTVISAKCPPAKLSQLWVWHLLWVC